MKLGLTIVYRLLWIIELAWGIGFFWMASDEFDNSSDFSSDFWLVPLTGVIGVAFLHFVFTSPIGKKLAEDKVDD